MKEYHKIENVFARDTQGTRKLLEGVFANETVAYLSRCAWEFTEKIDGTNIRVYWDGHRVSFAGRTDKANIPAHLFQRLMELFGGEENEQVFEQLFGGKEVILFGEGYGEKIQKVGSLYCKGANFILFDVMVGDKFLQRENIEAIAKAFGIDVVPVIQVGTIWDGVALVKNNPMSTIGEAPMEGVVGRPLVEVFGRDGRRIIVKIKARDFCDEKQA